MSTNISISSITSSDPLSKPARLQVDINSLQEHENLPPQQIGSSTFNVWFLKYSGGDSSAINSFVKSKFRVNIERDQGYTKARNNSPICLFFSRGCCYMGSNCKYYHCTPNKLKNVNTNYAVDCFGRNKTSDYNDDMDGVGSFNKINKTLYVGGLTMKPNIEELLSKNFEEFGDVEKVKVIYNKSIAFITMKTENDAQFAKEAMDRQCLIHYEYSSPSTTTPSSSSNTSNSEKSLGSSNKIKSSKEVLHIRWANPDRNPEAQAQEKRKFEELAMDTVKSMLNSDTTKRIKISEENSQDSNGKIRSPTEVVEVEELDDDLDEDDEGDSDDEAEDEDEDEDEEETNGKMVEGVQTTNTTSYNGINSNHNHHHRHYHHHNNINDNTIKSTKRRLSPKHNPNYKYGSINRGVINNGRNTASPTLPSIEDEDSPDSKSITNPRDIRNGYFNGNGIINDSTFKNISQLKKKLKFKKYEPCLLSVLSNYSSDEDDD
ncbi:CWC2 [Candida pseudojiufengensis]|uniref:CWC2 n=1 Tax=Candida pseudojiufengensis TaxID=497109 RepID=UPI0022248882|nr:CWC2 [Candida pseudojiufengensis]KAI5964591.1 CWC2 [Candida pseudojiufengensis]